jgi:hypothetical protein
MRDCENHDLGREVTIDDTEGKLLENVSSKISEVYGPAAWSLSDSFRRQLEGGFEIECCDEAAISVPSK